MEGQGIMEHKQAGNAAFGQARWKEAAEHYTAALQADPGLVAALANRAACWIHLAQFPNAIDDCDAALVQNAPVPLQTKLWWRKAVALRNLGSDRDAWERAVRAGLELDPANAKLLAEREYVFVKNVSTMPTVYTQSGAISQPNQPESDARRLPGAPQPQPSAQVSTFPLPLTYSGLLHLVRAKSEATHAFWYANVSGADLKRVLSAGVEPDMLDFLFSVMASHPDEPRNSEYAEAIKAAPRFETALFMADETTQALVKKF